MAGPAIDRAVEQLFLETLAPREIDLTLAVEHEVQQQADSLDKAWRARIEQAQYEARRAERRYKAVDPDNRVVARTLEGEWEHRLRELEEVEREHAEARRRARVELTPQDRIRIRELAGDLPTVWSAASTSAADRKAMLRLVIEAIAVSPIEIPERRTRLRIQWTRGTVTELEIARPGKGQYRTHSAGAIQRIRELAAAGKHDDEIAEQLNAESVRTGGGHAWKEEHVRYARRKHGIERTARDRPRMPPLPHRHPNGRYSVPGAAVRFGVSRNVVRAWIAQGLVDASRADFGTHRNVYWLDIDDTTAERLTTRGRRRKRSNNR